MPAITYSSPFTPRLLSALAWAWVMQTSSFHFCHQLFFQVSAPCPAQHPRAARLALLGKQKEKLGFREFFGMWPSLRLTLKSCRNSSTDGRVKRVLQIPTEFLSGKKQIHTGFPSIRHIQGSQLQCWQWQQRTSRKPVTRTTVLSQSGTWERQR